MRRVLAIGLLLAAGVGGCTAQEWNPYTKQLDAVIHEDDPRWDCATMGNKICGPGAGGQ